MENKRYIVTNSSDSTGNNIEIFFNEYAKYFTDICDENGNRKSSGWFRPIDVFNGNCPEINDEDESDMWLDAIIEYTKKYNESIKDATVKYTISDVNEDLKYRYQKIVNDKVVIADAWAWYSQIYDEKDRSAWLDAVEEYKRSKGEKLVKDVVEETKKEINKEIDKLDAEKMEMMDMVPPTVATAVANAKEDPCKFIEELMMGIASGKPTIDFKESAEYLKKSTKHNIKAVKYNARNSVAEKVRATVESMYDEVDKSLEYFREMDAAAEEFRKAHPKLIAQFEVCAADSIKWGGFNFDYMGVDGLDITDEEVRNILSQNTDDEILDFNRVAQPYKLNGKNKIESPAYEQNIKDSICYLFQPMLRAWNSYCKYKGWTTGWMITSGYRNKAYNASVGGVENSSHSVGFAIDVQPLKEGGGVDRSKVDDLCELIYRLCNASGGKFRFDQLLNEHKSDGGHWMHLGWKRGAGEQRGQYSPTYNADKNSSEGNVKYLNKV